MNLKTNVWISGGNESVEMILQKIEDLSIYIMDRTSQEEVFNAINDISTCVITLKHAFKFEEKNIKL